MESGSVKRLNFAVALKKQPIKDNIIRSIEVAIKDTPISEAEELWGEDRRVLKTANSLKNNITKTEQEALKDLRTDSSTAVLRADKGNASVIVDHTTYHAYIQAILDDKVFQAVPKDLTSKTERDLIKLLKPIDWDEEIRNILKWRLWLVWLAEAVWLS